MFLTSNVFKSVLNAFSEKLEIAMIESEDDDKDKDNKDNKDNKNTKEKKKIKKQEKLQLKSTFEKLTGILDHFQNYTPPPLFDAYKKFYPLDKPYRYEDDQEPKKEKKTKSLVDPSSSSSSSFAASSSSSSSSSSFVTSSSSSSFAASSSSSIVSTDATEICTENMTDEKEVKENNKESEESKRETKKHKTRIIKDVPFVFEKWEDIELLGKRLEHEYIGFGFQITNSDSVERKTVRHPEWILSYEYQIKKVLDWYQKEEKEYKSIMENNTAVATEDLSPSRYKELLKFEAIVLPQIIHYVTAVAFHRFFTYCVDYSNNCKNSEFSNPLTILKKQEEIVFGITQLKASLWYSHWFVRNNNATKEIYQFHVKSYFQYLLTQHELLIKSPIPETFNLLLEHVFALFLNIADYDPSLSFFSNSSSSFSSPSSSSFSSPSSSSSSSSLSSPSPSSSSASSSSFSSCSSPQSLSNTSPSKKRTRWFRFITAQFVQNMFYNHKYVVQLCAWFRRYEFGQSQPYKHSLASYLINNYDAFKQISSSSSSSTSSSTTSSPFAFAFSSSNNLLLQTPSSPTVENQLVRSESSVAVLNAHFTPLSFFPFPQPCYFIIGAPKFNELPLPHYSCIQVYDASLSECQHMTFTKEDMNTTIEKTISFLNLLKQYDPETHKYFMSLKIVHNQPRSK
jgi:hypothetical protein